MSSKLNLKTWLMAISGVAVILAVAGGWLLWGRFSLLAEVEALNNKVLTQEQDLATLTTAKAELESQLGLEQQKNEEFAEQIDDIADTVGTLDKIRKTDKELLAKYSKVYFLNENYVPKDLALINDEWWASQNKPLQIHTQIKKKLEGLLKAAAEDDVELLLVSAYRSFGTQAELKQNYRFTYGSTANSFSAEQGYSEHQLGTTVDFTTATVGPTLAGFDQTEAYKWLQDNAHRYGFILSYPEKNGYYQYEPWHWRYVGVDLASDLHADGKFFYDLDQRELDEYLVKFFD